MMNEEQSRKLFHDLKNDFASMSALTNLHRIYADKIKSEELIDRLQERQIVIALAYEKLYQNANYPFINLKTYIDELISRENRTLVACCGNVRITAVIADIELSLKKAMPLAQIAVELLSNSHRHAFIGFIGNKKIALSIEDTGQDIKLQYSDNGCGLPEGLIPERERTLGMQFIKSLSRQLGGKPVFKNTGDGLTVSINIKKD
jgi:two-component sensor histidine kinase